MHLPALISDLALMLIVAAITTLLFKKIRQPLVLGYLIAGFLTGPYFNLFPSVSDMTSIHTWSEIGIIILMFSLGLEFNLHKLFSVGGTAFITATTEVIAMLLLGFGCGQLMGWDTMNSIFLGGILSMSSTTIIIKAFDDLNLKGKKFTELVFGTLVIEDIAGIIMMVLLSTIAVSQNITGGELTGSMLKMIFYLALWLILGIYLIPSFLKKTQNLMNDETLLVTALGMCLGMVILAVHLGFSSALGAFLAGSLLAGTIHGERIEHISSSIKDIFGAVFFISVGMMVDPAVIGQYALPIMVITLITIIGKATFSSLGVLLSGQSLHTSVLCGCSLAQIGEFSFIIASLGISLGIIDNFIYPIVVAVSVITTFTTPFVIRSADGVYGLLDKNLPKKFSDYLNRHTAEDRTETEKDSDWSAFIKNYFSGLTIYTIIMLGIILVGISFLLPFLTESLIPITANILTIIVIIAVMAPFLRQSLFSHKNVYFISLWFKSRTNRLPLLVFIVLRLALMAFLIMLPIKIIFDFSTLYILLAAIALIFLISRSEWLIAPYLKIEARFLANYNERQLEERKIIDPNHRWLDEQLYVSRFTCDKHTAILDKPLSDLITTARLGIKVIKIIRNNKHINIPEAFERLLPGDIVFVTGNSTHLDNWQTIAKVELEKKETGNYATLHDFIKSQDEYAKSDQLFCYAVTVEKDSDLMGSSIKDSKIKSDWGGLLLGLERDLYPIIYPDLNMRIETNDLIWILGPQKMAGKLAKADVF